MRTLVTFIGRTERHTQGYREVTYEFEDGHCQRTPFLGFSLAERLRPDRLVVMGTAGSMWDLLLGVLPETRLAQAGAEELMLAVDDASVTQSQLDALAPGVAEALGCEVILRIIPVALEAEEQLQLVAALADAAAGSTEVALDVTHGYRHLPMLVLMSALYLRELNPGLAVRGIWYAPLNPHADHAVVRDLGGVLHIADWLSALQRSELTGDYGEVAHLISDSEIAQGLVTAGFKEAIHQGQQARKTLQRVRQRLREAPLSGAGALFQPVLEARTRWVEHQHLYQRQREHALAALARGDFLRAALYGYEAYITKLVRLLGPANADPNNREVRERVKEEYHDNGPANPDWDAFKHLRDVRNVLAHGNRANEAEVQAALNSPEALRALLEKAFETLLSETE